MKSSSLQRPSSFWRHQDALDHQHFRDRMMREFDAQFRLHARRMLSYFPLVKRWEDTDDVIQSALIRIHRRIKSLRIESELHFQRIAAQQLRRQLYDFARRYNSRSNHAAHHESHDGNLAIHSGHREEPTLEEWAEFHRCVDELPDRLQNTFELIWYTGLTQQQSAEVLGISERQCQRRWQEARIVLSRRLSASLLLQE